jgi:transcriptional regulator with XRE-family HTH domain
VKRKRLTPTDEAALAHLDSSPTPPWDSSAGDWIRILRTRLRMTQTELAARAGITQSHLVGIESGKTDPRLSTVKRLYEALSCRLSLQPKPLKPVDEILRGRARSMALKRLKQSAGSMALEGQAPEADMFRRVLESQTDEILADRRNRLWEKPDEEYE